MQNNPDSRKLRTYLKKIEKIYCTNSIVTLNFIPSEKELEKIVQNSDIPQNIQEMHEHMALHMAREIAKKILSPEEILPLYQKVPNKPSTINLEKYLQPKQIKKKEIQIEEETSLEERTIKKERFDYKDVIHFGIPPDFIKYLESFEGERIKIPFYKRTFTAKKFEYIKDVWENKEKGKQWKEKNPQAVKASEYFKTQ